MPDAPQPQPMIAGQGCQNKARNLPIEWMGGRKRRCREIYRRIHSGRRLFVVFFVLVLVFLILLIGVVIFDFFVFLVVVFVLLVVFFVVLVL